MAIENLELKKRRISRRSMDFPDLERYIALESGTPWPDSAVLRLYAAAQVGAEHEGAPILPFARDKRARLASTR